MSVKLFVLSCLFASSLAWLAPERCSQGSDSRTVTKTNVRVVPSIEEIAGLQQDRVVAAYEGYEYISVPSQILPYEPFPQKFPDGLIVHAPYNCTFHTYEPRLLVSIACGADLTCKLSQSIATVDTYTAAEGYTWGVKLNAKFSLFDKMFEIGGEASTGGTYTCTYTKGRTTSTLAECTDNTGQGGNLRLYTVKTDMMCDFGTVKYKTEERGEDPQWFFVVDQNFDYFTSTEVAEIKNCVQIKVIGRLVFLLDTDKITDTLLLKLMRKAPLYNPSTDLIDVEWGGVYGYIVTVIYYKIDEDTREYDLKRLVPFTNKDGDSVYQFACDRTSF